MSQPDEENPSRASLENLQQRIEAAKPEEKSSDEAKDKFSMAEVGWRMVTELVAGIMLGAGLGYGIDQVAATAPWGLIIGVLLGSVAGIRVMLNTAKTIEERNKE